MNDSAVLLARLLPVLEAGARRHAARDASARASLALACARSVAEAAEDWVDAAVTMKRAGSLPARQAAGVRAEETATGPLVTLRLLLITARACAEQARFGRPRSSRPPRLARAGRGGGPLSLVEVEVLPEPRLFDRMVFRNHSATVRCVDPGGLEAFEHSWRREAADRPRGGGIAVVLGAGNVTGLSCADSLCQVFEHGRAVLLKLHPVQAGLEPVLRRALGPLVEAGLVAIVVGDPQFAREAASAAAVTHVHLTGGQQAFDSLVWGGPERRAGNGPPLLSKPVTCELGNVTPWIVVPGRYTAAQLACQADTVAASIVNNTSFNCIATKCIVTCRGWRQREEFLGLVRRRLESLPARPAWYPGASAAWESATDRLPPDDGTLPVEFRTGLDADADRRLLEREWFAPVAVETPVEADDMEAFCTRVARLVEVVPGSLAASVSLPGNLPPRDRQRAELLIAHLEYGVVAVNGWAAMGYSWGSVPWGGFPGATLSAPGSGIGRVHDPLLLPLVHNAIVRVPLASWPPPPWFPWHPRARELARGLVATYAAIGRGRSGLWPFLRMLPDVLEAAVRPPARP